MCLLIIKPKGIPLTQHIIDRVVDSIESNPDGFGIGYYQMGVPQTTKTLDKQYFKQCLTNMLGYNDVMLIHTRMTTHGTTDIHNVHPFVVHGKIVGHNGVFSSNIVPTHKTKSDTRMFVENIIKPLESDFNVIGSDSHNYLAPLVDGYNKLGVISPDGTYTIFNEEAGHWLDGVWYSNYTYYKYDGLSTYPDWYDDDDFGKPQGLTFLEDYMIGLLEKHNLVSPELEQLIISEIMERTGV